MFGFPTGTPKYLVLLRCIMAKSAGKGKKGSAGGNQPKQNQGNSTAKKAKNGGKKK